MRLIDGFPDHPTLSASQIKAWRDCPRKWGFDKIDRVPRVERPALALGTRVHAILEDWLRNGTPPDESEIFQGKYPGRIAAAGLPLLPAPPQARVEEKFWLEVEPGIVFYGFIDLLITASVWDHKTSSNMSRYALTPGGLLKDSQALIYAAVGFTDRARNGSWVGMGLQGLRWVYYATNGPPAAKLVKADISPDAVVAGMADVTETGRQILLARKTCKSALELPPNPGHCSAYGGCEHNERCTISSKERFVNAMGNDTKNDNQAILDAWLAEHAPGGVPAPVKRRDATPPPVPAPAPEVPTVPAPEVPAVPAPAPPVPEVPPAFESSDRSTWSREQVKTYGVSVGAFDQSCRCQAPGMLKLIEEFEGQSQFDPAAEAAARDATPPPVPPTEATPQSVIEAVTETLEIHGTNADGERVVEKIPISPDGLVTVPIVGDWHETGKTPRDEQRQWAAVGIGADIPILYVDCVPYGSGDFTPLSRLVAAAKDQLGYDMDYRIEEENAFGKAAGRLSDAVAALIVPGDNVQASSRLAEHRDCLTMLEGRCGQMIKGV